MAAVASEAGLPEERLRDLFPSKKDLLTALVDDQHDTWVRALSAAVTDHTDARDRVLAVFTFLEGAEIDTGPCTCARVGLEGGHDAHVERHVTELNQLVGALCRAGGYPSPVAHAIALMVEGVLVEAPVLGAGAPARETLATAYAGIEWNAELSDETFKYRYSAAGDSSMTLRSVTFDGRLDGEMPAGDDIVVQWITRGHGTLDLGRDEIHLEAGTPRLWPSEAFKFSFSDYDQRLVQVNREAVAEIATERGVRADQLRFDHTQDLAPEALATWRNSMNLIAKSVLDRNASPLLQAEMGRLGAMATLELVPQKAYSLPDELLLPRMAHVRAAVEYIHENAHLPLTAGDIAKIANIGVRALQVAFNKLFGMSPVPYLRTVRLQHVHDELVVADPATTAVRDVALRWGFAHAGRFSATYAEHFGEYPTATLRR